MPSAVSSSSLATHRRRSRSPRNSLSLCADPPSPRAFWLNDRHLEIANERSKRFGRAANKSFNLRAVKRAFKSPQTLLIPTLYVASQLAQQGYLYFNLWLKSLKNADGSPRWSITQVNALPMAGYAASILCVWMWGFVSDRFQNRWIVVAGQGVSVGYPLPPSTRLTVRRLSA